jgi:hypothetical protein
MSINIKKKCSKKKNHQFKIISSNGFDLALLQNSICNGLSIHFTHVIVSTVDQTQNIVLQLGPNQKKINADEVARRIMGLYPETSGAMCSKVYIRHNIDRVAGRVTENTRVLPSISNFSHVEMSFAYRMESYAKICFMQGLTNENDAEALVDKLNESAESDKFFSKYRKSARSQAIKMFKSKLKKVFEEHRKSLVSASEEPVVEKCSLIPQGDHILTNGTPEEILEYCLRLEKLQAKLESKKIIN